MILKIKHENEKINIGLSARDSEASAVEKDVLSGLYPHVSNLLNQLLGQEGFKESDKNQDRKEESALVDKMGVPMSQDYMVANGMVEPESGPEIIDRDSINIRK